MVKHKLIEMKVNNYIEILPYKPGASWHKRTIFDINEVYVHHSGVKDGTIQSYNNYHIQPGNHISENGCPHLCYHLFIDYDGSVYQANYLTDITWHIGTKNNNSVGILVNGNFTHKILGTGVEEPTNEQIYSLRWVLETLEKFPNIKRTGMFGHEDHYNEVNYACPGDTIINWINKFKKE